MSAVILSCKHVVQKVGADVDQMDRRERRMQQHRGQRRRSRSDSRRRACRCSGTILILRRSRLLGLLWLLHSLLLLRMRVVMMVRMLLLMMRGRCSASSRSR